MFRLAPVLLFNWKYLEEGQLYMEYFLHQVIAELP